MRAGRAVPLLPKACRLLEALLAARPRVVSQDELRRLLWPEIGHGGTRAKRLVNEVRAAIGDDARPPRFIRTVHRFGYAFSGAVTEESAATAAAATGCALEWGERLVPLAPGENVIGRTPEALISVTASRVSRRHARILVTEAGAMLEDLGSKNGTFLGDRRIEEAQPLRSGDCIVVGPLRLFFRVVAVEETRSS
ncbi:MAG TPA: FHA domain-containing protein [Vicinamibacteria bacterium]